ncbi:MAG TPA: universal stress protein [Actinospica sp.]|nr:universal stress protein [Actinospica sp.]
MSTNPDATEVRRVLAGLDSSQSAAQAVSWAAREAQARGVPLTLAHALRVPTA